jgi:DNA repair protein RecN (Recombination protein N)
MRGLPSRRSSLQAAKAAVEDVSAVVRDFADKVHASPERLAEIEDRLAALDRLKRKYGQAGAAARTGRGDPLRRRGGRGGWPRWRTAMRCWRNCGFGRSAMRRTYRAAAKELTGARTAAAARLEKLATAEINDLAMSVRFKVQVLADEESSATWSAHGWDRVEYSDCDQCG